MPNSVPDMTGQELYRGNVNTWECDEMGHLNVRFYVAKAQEALAVLGHKAGINPRYKRENGTTLTVVDHHIRFLREAHAGAPLYACGGVLDHGAHDFRVLIELRHALSNQVAATFNTLVHHTDPDMGARIPLPAKIKQGLEALRIDLPDHARPRSLTLDPPQGKASLEQADAYGLVTIAHGLVTQAQCNENGLMQTQHFIGRISDGIAGFMFQMNPQARKLSGAERRGGAVVEYRLCYHNRPRAGDIIMVRSGLKGVTDKTVRLVHWILDGVNGRALATTEAVAISFDLDTRKVITYTDEEHAALEKLTIPELEI